MPLAKDSFVDAQLRPHYAANPDEFQEDGVASRLGIAQEFELNAGRLGAPT